MKILAPKSEKVSCSLRRAGLTDNQARRLLNRALLCLNFVGSSKRVSVEIFRCFSGEVRVKGLRSRFHQVLLDAGLIKVARPHVQGLCSAEYKTRGASISQQIKLTKEEAQISRKVEAERRKANKADKTLQWLCKALRHQFEAGAYLANEELPRWHSVSLSRAFAGTVAEAIRRQIRQRYFRQSAEENFIVLDDGEEGRQYRQSKLSADFHLFTVAAKFADSQMGKPCSVESLRGLDHRIEHLAKAGGFEFLKLRFHKNLVEGVVACMKQNNFPCATDGLSIYAENAEALETAFVNEVQYQLCVDVTQREKPILTPLYIDSLRRLKAKIEGIELKEVPRARAKYWKAPEWTPKRKTFAPDCQVLASVEEAKAFYGVDPEAERAKAFYGFDPEAEEANAVTLFEARRQIARWGSVKASNAEEATAELYEMGHALPTEPTRQEWELTQKGRDCLLASEGKSATRPLPERLRA